MGRKRRKKPSSSFFQRAVEASFRPRRLCVIAAILTALISLPYLRAWLPDLREQPEYVVSVSNIHINEPPPWVPQDIARQAFDRAGLPSRMSLLDAGLVRQIADAFLVHPWVKSVQRVEKHHPAGVRVLLTYREPVAMVEVSDGLYPIDADGVLLPPRDFREPDVYRYPIVTRIGSTPAGEIGQPWGDPVVLGAARLAEILAQKDEAGKPFWTALGINRIESPSRITAEDSLEDFIYRLHTPGGSRIIWGRAPGTGHPGEVTADKKIRRLQEYLADYGGYETAHGPSELDIRHWHEISHRALAKTPGNDGQRQ